MSRQNFICPMKNSSRLQRAAAIAAGLLALCLATSGCATTEHGTKIERDSLAQIKKGTTTRAEAERLLGAPASVSVLPDGKRMLLYQYSSSSRGVTKGGVAATVASSALLVINPIAGMVASSATDAGGTRSSTRTQTLQVLVSAAGIVEDYELTDGTATTTAGVGGWETKTSTASADKPEGAR